MENAAFAGLGVNPDDPAMALDHLFAKGKADACSLVIGIGVQTLEDAKYSGRVLLLHANAVVGDVNAPH